MSYFTPAGDPKLFACSCARAGCDAPPPNPDLLARLETLRARVGRPIIVTSGPRCAYWNLKEDGKPNSDHLTGDGADLRAATSAERWALLAANFTGDLLFTRLGIGKTFVHVGLTTRNVGDVVWTYY